MTHFFSCLRRLWPPAVFLAALAALAVLACVYAPARALPRAPWRDGAPLRVGAPEPVRQATAHSPYGPGVETELIHRFCEEASCTPEWVPVHGKEEGLNMLRRGEIHVLVGFWGDEPVTEPARDAESAAEEDAPPLVAGSAYAHFNPVRIKGAVAPRPPAQQRETAPGNFSVLDSLASVFAGSFFTRQDMNTATSSGEDPPFPIFALLNENGENTAEDILLIDPASYALWLPFMGDVDTRQIKQPTPYRWFWREDEAALNARLTAFWAASERTAELKELKERYFGFLPRSLRRSDILELSEALAAHLPKYAPFIMNAAKETGVPPLLLVAAIYQESRFDADAVSETRVRGIMQLTAATARMLDVDRRDPEQCIMGGARYLRDLKDRVEDKADNEWDRWFMALAAYNQGMSNLNRAIRLSKEIGGKGNSWADLKRAFPLSTTCRGLEARSFVERIRYYHFILHGLVALAPAEAQDLAPLLGLALADASF